MHKMTQYQYLQHTSYADIRLSPWIFRKDMNNDQLAVWLYNYPGLMGADYHHDIGKLKGINNKNILCIIFYVIIINI